MSRLYAKPLPPGTLLLVLLFAAVLLSAIAVAYSAHWNRQLLNALYTELSVRDKIQAVSMEAKASAAIIGSLPPIVTILIWLTTPKYIEILWLTEAGKFAMVAGGLWMLMGVLVMRKMINFDI